MAYDCLSLDQWTRSLHGTLCVKEDTVHTLSEAPLALGSKRLETADSLFDIDIIVQIVRGSPP